MSLDKLLLDLELLALGSLSWLEHGGKLVSRVEAHRAVRHPEFGGLRFLLGAALRLIAAVERDGLLHAFELGRGGFRCAAGHAVEGFDCVDALALAQVGEYRLALRCLRGRQLYCRACRAGAVRRGSASGRISRTAQVDTLGLDAARRPRARNMGDAVRVHPAVHAIGSRRRAPRKSRNGDKERPENERTAGGAIPRPGRKKCKRSHLARIIAVRGPTDCGVRPEPGRLQSARSAVQPGMHLRGASAAGRQSRVRAEANPH